MSRPRIEVVETDFQNVVAHLVGKGVLPKDVPVDINAALRRMHSSIYASLIWKVRLQDVPERGKVFLKEIASDCIQILPLTSFGFRKAPMVLLRGAIENCLRYVYFIDHPIEFEWMNDPNKKWFLQPSEFFSYMKEHPKLVDINQEFQLTQKLQSSYDSLCKIVHGSRVENMQMVDALSKVVLDKSLVLTQSSIVEETLSCVNLAMWILNHPRTGFSRSDDRIVKRAMTTAARRALLKV